MKSHEAAAVAARMLHGEDVAAVAEACGCRATALEAWYSRAIADLQAVLEGGEAPDPTPPRPVLHHVGVVARDEDHMRRFANLLGLQEVRRERLAAYRVTNVFFSPGHGPQIQFMLPEGGILANFNGGRGGLHHIAFWAPDITPVQRDLEARGLRFIAREKQQGIGDFKFNFVLPNVEGISVELIEDPDYDWAPHR